MLRELENTSRGQYLVTTATGSHYLLDLDARTMTRRMAATAPRVDFLTAGFSVLRRDGDAIELLMLELCEVGSPARLWISVRDDHIPTLRTTSPVVNIESLSSRT